MKYVSISSLKEFWKREVAVSQSEGRSFFGIAPLVTEEEVSKLNLSRRFISNEVGDTLWGMSLNRINLKFNLKNMFENDMRVLGVFDDFLVERGSVECGFLSLSRLFFSYQRKAGIDLRVSLKSNYSISGLTSFSSVLFLQRALLIKSGAVRWGGCAWIEFPFKTNLVSSIKPQASRLQCGVGGSSFSRPRLSFSKKGGFGEIFYWIPFRDKAALTNSCGLLHELAIQFKRNLRVTGYFCGPRYFDVLRLFYFWVRALNRNRRCSPLWWQVLYLRFKDYCCILKNLVKIYSFGKKKRGRYFFGENLSQVLNFSGFDRCGLISVSTVYSQFSRNFFLVLLQSYSRIGWILHHLGYQVSVNLSPGNFTSSYFKRGRKILEWVAAFFVGALDFNADGRNFDKNFLGHYRVLNKLEGGGKCVLFPFRVREDYLNFQAANSSTTTSIFLWYFLGNLLSYSVQAISKAGCGFKFAGLQKLLVYRRISCSLRGYNAELHTLFCNNFNMFLSFMASTINMRVWCNVGGSSAAWLFSSHSLIFAKNFEINKPPTGLQVLGDLEGTVSAFIITGSGLPHSAFFFRHLHESRAQFCLYSPNSLLVNQFSVDELFNRRTTTIFNLNFFDSVSLNLLRLGLGGPRLGNQTRFDRLGRKLTSLCSIFKSPLNRMKFFFNRLDSNIVPNLLFTNSFVSVQTNDVSMCMARNVLTRQFWAIGLKQRCISRRRFKFKQKRFSTSAQLYYGMSFKNIFYTL